MYYSSYLAAHQYHSALNSRDTAPNHSTAHKNTDSHPLHLHLRLCAGAASLEPAQEWSGQFDAAHRLCAALIEERKKEQRQRRWKKWWRWRRRKRCGGRSVMGLGVERWKKSCKRKWREQRRWKQRRAEGAICSTPQLSYAKACTGFGQRMQ